MQKNIFRFYIFHIWQNIYGIFHTISKYFEKKFDIY